MSATPFNPDAFGALEALFKALHEGVIVLDKRGRVVFVNDSMTRIMGLLSMEIAPPITYADVLNAVEIRDEHGGPVDPEQLPSRLAFSGQTPPPRELLFLGRTSGSKIWTIITATPLPGEGGAIEHVALVFRDVTAERRSSRFLRFLTEASRALSASLDYHATLQTMLRLVVPELADACFVELFEEDGSVLYDQAHVSPAQLEIARELVRRYGARSRMVLRKGAAQAAEPQLIPSVSDAMLQDMALDEEHLALLRAQNLKSLLTVPLTARGRWLGTIILGMTAGDRRFTNERHSLAVELGVRAALALDNARLYQEAQAAFRRKDEEARINDALQRLGLSFASQLDPDKLLQLITEETTSLTGASFGLFFRAGERDARALATAGTPAGAASLLPAAWLASLFRSGGAPLADVRCDDLAAHPCPPGAPAPPEVLAPPLSLRSLMAVPVISRSGEVLGGLMLGHSRPRAFTPEHERAVASIAAQSAVALDNARFIQDLRAAQAELRTSEERLHLALSAGRMGYYDVDLTLSPRRAAFSPRMAELYGQFDGSFVLSWDTINTIIHPEDAAGVKERMYSLIASDRDTDSFEFRVVWPDGSIHWLERFNKIMRDESGRALRLLGIAQDTTERHQAQERLEKLLKELVRSNTELEQFAYIASHDLQEPLRMVASYTQLLGRRYQGKLDADADDFIRYAVDGVTRMKQLINDLLTYSRAGTATKPLAPVSCQQVLGRTLENLSTTIRESGAEVTADPLPEVMGDGVQLGQLFQNLIGNALKFRGDAPPRVHVGVEREDGTWRFSVRDNGIGIPAEYFQTIFVIFQRLHSGERYSGSGLGLAICKKIVERHGGRIWVESQPGQGATFFFTLTAVGTQASQSAPSVA